MPRIVVHHSPARVRAASGGTHGGAPRARGGFGGTPGVIDAQAGYHAQLEHAATSAASQLRAQQAQADTKAHAHLEQVTRNRELLAQLEATDPDLRSDPRYGYLRGVADTGGDLSHAVQFVAHERDQRAAAAEKAKAKETARAEQGNRSHLLLDGLAKEDHQFAASREFPMFRFMADNGADISAGVRSWYAQQERAAARMKAVAPSVPDAEAAAILVKADPKLDPGRALGIVQAQRAGITGKFHVSEAGAGAHPARDPLLPNVTDTELADKLKAGATTGLAEREKARTALRARGLDDAGDPLNVPPGAPAGFVGHGRLMQDGDKGFDPKAAAGGFVNARDDYGRPWQMSVEEAARHGLIQMPGAVPSPQAPKAPAKAASAGGPVPGGAAQTGPQGAGGNPNVPAAVPAQSGTGGAAAVGADGGVHAPQPTASPSPTPYDHTHWDAAQRAVAAFTQQTGAPPDPANPQHMAALRELATRALTPAAPTAPAAQPIPAPPAPAPPAPPPLPRPDPEDDQDPRP